MTLSQVRKYALSLPATTEEPHFDRTSFRVAGKIFATASPEDKHLNVFVGEPHRDRALNLYSGQMEKLWWGKKVVGLRITLAKTSAAAIKDLLHCAWLAKAPKSVASAAGIANR